MTFDGDGRNESEVNQCLHREGKKDELRVNKNGEDVKDMAVQDQEVLQVPQEHSHGAVACWESFLHLRSITVLLVENDDSTRHVISALLRNHSYGVMEAANGLQAWRILEDLDSHIDLVLTAAVMPCLSGIGLLCKITSHQSHKNIPVIIMSSHDSMGLVFKCLSRGAVDFLLKPIRKNELKNLWQHVWRRCHSSSGSASESGTQTQMSTKSKRTEQSDNRGSNDGFDSIGLNVGAGSDDGSGTESSWTKQAVEVDSSQAVSPRRKMAECPDSTCPHVILPIAKASSNKCVPVTAARECQEPGEHFSTYYFDNFARGKELFINGPIDHDLPPQPAIEIPAKLVGRKQKRFPEISSCTFTKQMDKADGGTSSTKHEVDISNPSDPQTDSTALEMKVKAFIDFDELPAYKLSLKRLRKIGDILKDS